MSKIRNLSGMPNLRELLDEAQVRGLSVERVNGTGEVRVYRSDGTKVTCNIRKKGGNQALLKMVRKAIRE